MENTNEAKSDDKKKRKPTLAYYQPPGSRFSTQNKASPTQNDTSQKPPDATNNLPPASQTSVNTKTQHKNEKPANTVQKDLPKAINEQPQASNNRSQPQKEPQIPKQHQEAPKSKQEEPKRQFNEKRSSETAKTEPKKSENHQPNQQHYQRKPKTEEPKAAQQQASNETRAGILKINIPKTPEPVQQQPQKSETPIPQKTRQLFDPNNPSKPIIINQKPEKAYNTQQGNKRGSAYSRDFIYEPAPVAVVASPPTETKISETKINETKAQTLIQLMEPIKNRLKQLIENCDFHNYSDSSAHINDLRNQLADLCVQSTCAHIESASNAEVDVQHWKSSYHQLIESLRHQYNSNTDTSYQSQLKKHLETLIKEGFEFYEAFISRLEERFQFNRHTIATTEIRSKNTKLAALCLHRCLICMGDLARYREMLLTENASKDYSEARAFYQHAMQVAPKSSRAYNQLAILALYTKRRFDSVYYYIRCLEVSTPLLTARQSLMSLFDEARKRSEFITENLLNKKNRQAKNINNKNTTSMNRVELWVRSSEMPNASICSISAPKLKLKNPQKKFEDESDEDIDDDDNDEDNDIDLSDDEYEFDGDCDVETKRERVRQLKKLSVSELNKRFMLDYLNTIGKLFSKVAMETYAEVCSRMLHEFNELLRRQPCPIGRMRLLQINVINMSIVDLTAGKMARFDEAADVVVRRSESLECAVQLSLDMFAILVKHLAKLLACEGGEGEATAGDWLMSVKIFVEWMMCNSRLWYPFPDQLPPDLGPNPHLCNNLASLFNVVQALQKKDLAFCEPNNGVIVVLEEDVEVAGFVPLLSMPRDASYVRSDCDMRLAKDFKRFEKIVMFADYLCGLENPLMKYDVVNKKYETVVVAKSMVTPKTEAKEKVVEIGDEVLIGEIEKKVEEMEISDGDNEELNRLIEKRKMLKTKVEEQMKREQSLQSIVEMSVNRRIEIEIRPRFLVPDTNCFINNLNLVQKLLKCNRYIIVVPLVVINELDKLAKSICNYNDDSVEHAEMVQRNAKLSMQYLNERFEMRERNLKALTSQGSVLETIQFRSEEIKTQVCIFGDFFFCF